MKSNNYSKILNKIFVIIFACTNLGAQEGEVIEITKDIGYTLDAEENLHYEIFTDIPNFESAQFFEISSDFDIFFLSIHSSRSGIKLRTFCILFK